MQKYPLEPLLSVRHFREENAKQAVRSAEIALQDAEEKIRQCEAELATYHSWRLEEENRRYDAIMGKPQTMDELDAFKAGLAQLKDGELNREELVLKAKEERQKKAEALDTARETAIHARKETAKIQAHKNIWSEEAKKEEERQADLELEEFKPLTPQNASEDDE